MAWLKIINSHLLNKLHTLFCKETFSVPNQLYTLKCSTPLRFHSFCKNLQIPLRDLPFKNEKNLDQFISKKKKSRLKMINIEF